MHQPVTPSQDNSSTAATSTGIEPNVAALLSYVLGWITGVIFLVIEKRHREVRFHAAQSLLLFGGISALWIVISILTGALFWTVPMLAVAIYYLSLLIGLATLAAWIVLMVSAYQGKHIRLPVIAPIAERMSTPQSP